MSRPRLGAEDVSVLQRAAQPHQQPGPPLQAVDGVVVADLQPAGDARDVQPAQPRAVDLARRGGVAAEQAGLEHLQAGDGEALAAAVDLAGLGAAVAPLGAGARVEQDGDEEEVDEAAGALLGVDGGGPRGHELVDAGAAADVEVLPAAVGRDGGVVRRVVSLLARIACQCRRSRRRFALCGQCVVGLRALTLMMDTT